MPNRHQLTDVSLAIPASATEQSGERDHLPLAGQVVASHALVICIFLKTYLLKQLSHDAWNDLGQLLLDMTVEHNSLYVTSYWLVINFNVTKYNKVSP